MDNNTTVSIRFMKALVASIMHDTNREWTVQGFGFLRTYFGPPDVPKRYRLNVWHSALTVPNVSTIHDHPWNFTSLIVAGKTENTRYYTIKDDIYPTHKFAEMHVGIESKLEMDDIKPIRLIPFPKERYLEGDTYYQHQDEIHETRFADGSVTVNERVGDTEHARIFWPHDQEWVNAKPRLATMQEVWTITQYSLNRWFV